MKKISEEWLKAAIDDLSVIMKIISEAAEEFYSTAQYIYSSVKTHLERL